MAESKKKMSKKKKTLIIFISIFAFLIISAGAVALWQKTNIEAFIMSRKYSSREILDKMSENDKQLKEEIEKYFPEGIRDFTPEEKELIDSGTVSEKQMIAKIISEEISNGLPSETMEEIMQGIYEKIVGDQQKINANVDVAIDDTEVLIPVPLTTQQANPSSPSSEGEKKTLVIVGKPASSVHNSSTPSNTSNAPPSEATADSIISKYVSQLYALEAKYIGAIEGVVASAKAEAKAQGLTKKDTSKLLSIGAKYTGAINSLEAQCDGEVGAVISNLTRELNAINASTDIVSTIRSAYASEKSLKRAYYMNMIGI